MVFRNFLENSFFSVEPHVVENADLLGFWPGSGRRHLEKFRARAENRKSQFPGARGPEMKKKNHRAIRDGCPRLFLALRFARPDPHLREIAKHEGRGFQAILAWDGPRHSEKFRGWAENGRMELSGARSTFFWGGGGSGRAKRFLPESAQLFDAVLSGRPDPHGREITKCGFCRRFWPRTALGTWRHSGATEAKHKQPY